MGEQDFKEIPDESYEDVIEQLASQRKGTQFTQSDIEQDVDRVLSSLPKMKRDQLRKEMAEMEYDVPQTPTTFDINEGMAKTQGYKDRLVEILVQASREHRIRKATLNLLVAANSVNSKQSSADKREGEAMLKYAIMVMQLEACEIFIKEVEHILNNVKSASEAISRQGSMIQAQISLGEYRKRIKGDSIGGGNEAEEARDYHSNTAKIDIDW